jgi:hypothetical protein
MLPLVRLRAFEARLKRILKTLDARGMIDPDTGLLTADAFWRELARAVDEAQAQGTGLAVARFAFDPAQVGRRASFDAARLIAGTIRNIDFAHREDAGSVLVAFTETDLRGGNIVARRLASMLRTTMLVNARAPHRPTPAITLTALKGADTLDTLVTRVGSRVPAPVATA